WHVGFDGGVVGLDGGQRLSRIDIVELLNELLQGIGAHLGDALDAVLVTQQVQHLGIEYLPAELARLRQDHATVFGVGVVAKVGALVEEALAVGIDHDRERIVVLLEVVAHRQVPEFGGVAIPGDGVTSRPIAGWLGADVERHADAVTGVEARAAHLGQLPAGPQVARAPFGVGLKAARGQHHALGRDLAGPARRAHAYAPDAGVI